MDEIDYEFLGRSPKNITTNYFYRGILNYTNYEEIEGNDLTKGFHLYTLNYTPDRIEWLLDGKLQRTLYQNKTYDTTNITNDVPTSNLQPGGGAKNFKTITDYLFPTDPMRIRFSIWDTTLMADGTKQWGGVNDYKKSAYYAIYKNISISCWGENYGGVDSFTSGTQDKVISILPLTLILLLLIILI
jgi:beta-glucanase (GH16 family)